MTERHISASDSAELEDRIAWLEDQAMLLLGAHTADEALDGLYQLRLAFNLPARED